MFYDDEYTEDMIKNIKAWFTQKTGVGGKKLNVEVEVVESHLSYRMIETLSGEIVSRIAEDFIKENNDKLTKDILNNRKFADAVYNAIVLRKAKEVI